MTAEVRLLLILLFALGCAGVALCNLLERMQHMEEGLELLRRRVQRYGTRLSVLEDDFEEQEENE